MSHLININSERQFLLQATNLNIELPMQNVLPGNTTFGVTLTKRKVFKREYMREYMKRRREQSSNKAEKHSTREEKSKKPNNFSTDLSKPTILLNKG